MTYVVSSNKSCSISISQLHLIYFLTVNDRLLVFFLFVKLFRKYETHVLSFTLLRIGFVEVVSLSCECYTVWKVPIRIRGLNNTYSITDLQPFTRRKISVWVRNAYLKPARYTVISNIMKIPFVRFLIFILLIRLSYTCRLTSAVSLAWGLSGSGQNWNVGFYCFC